MYEIPDQVLQDLKCVNCDQYLSYSPIRLTPDGTNICGRCINQEEDGDGITDYAYEVVVKVFLFPCRYKDNGCKEKFSIKDVPEHEQSCLYKDKFCPEKERNCAWNGKYSSLMDHYLENHPNLIIEHPCSWKPDLSKDNEANLLMKVSDYLFLVNINFVKKYNVIKHSVRFLGESKLHKMFKYYLEIRGKNGSLKRNEELSLHLTNIETNLDVLKGFDSYDNLEIILR